MADSVIAARIRSQLEVDAGLPTASNLDVEVQNGVVQLSGSVDSVQEKTRAATLASSIEGVHDVRNDIAVNR